MHFLQQNAVSCRKMAFLLQKNRDFASKTLEFFDKIEVAERTRRSLHLLLEILQSFYVWPESRSSRVGTASFCRNFPGGFFRALFPHKNEENESGKKSTKKSGGPKIKISENSVLPKTDPKKTIARNRGVSLR